jgi:hypothetical protein
MSLIHVNISNREKCDLAARARAIYRNRKFSENNIPKTSNLLCQKFDCKSSTFQHPRGGRPVGIALVGVWGYNTDPKKFPTGLINPIRVPAYSSCPLDKFGSSFKLVAVAGYGLWAVRCGNCRPFLGRDRLRQWGHNPANENNWAEFNSIYDYPARTRIPARAGCCQATYVLLGSPREPLK